MPQAKRVQFQVVGKYTDANGDQRRPGDLIELEVGKDGLPLDGLAAARVRPFRGRVVGQSTDASGIIEGARAEAARIIDEASKQAESIISEASKKPAK